MATYNNLPTEVTANVFSYLRHERRQPPHAYCIDRLIEYTHDLIDPYMGLTDEGERIYEDLNPEPAREFFGDFVGEAVVTSFFCPYVEDMGYDEYNRELDDYREPQYLSWTYAYGDMTRKYDHYDKNGRVNVIPH